MAAKKKAPKEKALFKGYRLYSRQDKMVAQMSKKLKKGDSQIVREAIEEKHLHTFAESL